MEGVIDKVQREIKNGMAISEACVRDRESERERERTRVQESEWSEK